MDETRKSIIRFRKNQMKLGLNGVDKSENFDIEMDFFSPVKNRAAEQSSVLPLYVKKKQPHEIRNMETQTVMDMENFSRMSNHVHTLAIKHRVNYDQS